MATTTEICKVKYFHAKGKGPEWRPLFKNQNNPAQFDKHALNLIEMARMKCADEQFNRRTRTPGMASTAVGWSHGTESLDVSGRWTGVSRTASLPGNCTRTFNTKALPGTQSVFRLTGGTGLNRHELGSSPGVAPEQIRGAHIPGYTGFVPGFNTDSLAIANNFSRGTIALGRQRDGFEDSKPPLPQTYAGR
mmetsp:Transcript_78448/g.141549  ORF Transcript_78448/g.141549 Transcript_78448/m.141549 type:complete len:192 (-) Transcript_78448:54-629(-)